MKVIPALFIVGVLVLMGGAVPAKADQGVCLAVGNTRADGWKVTVDGYPGSWSFAPYEPMKILLYEQTQYPIDGGTVQTSRTIHVDIPGNPGHGRFVSWEFDPNWDYQEHCSKGTWKATVHD